MHGFSAQCVNAVDQSQWACKEERASGTAMPATMAVSSKLPSWPCWLSTSGKMCRQAAYRNVPPEKTMHRAMADGEASWGLTLMHMNVNKAATGAAKEKRRRPLRWRGQGHFACMKHDTRPTATGALCSSIARATVSFRVDDVPRLAAPTARPSAGQWEPLSSSRDGRPQAVRGSRHAERHPA